MPAGAWKTLEEKGHRFGSNSTLSWPASEIQIRVKLDFELARVGNPNHVLAGLNYHHLGNQADED